MYDRQLLRATSPRGLLWKGASPEEGFLMTSATINTAAAPPVLSRLMSGTFWLALKTPLAAVLALWSIPLTQRYIGLTQNDAYVFAWGFGFIQFVLEFGMGSSLQKQVTDAWSRGDRAAVDRTIACGMNFYALAALIQMAILLGITYGGLPARFQGNSLVIGLLWVQILTTPFYGMSAVVGAVLQAARRYEFIPRLELAIIVLRFALLVIGYWSGAPFLLVVAGQVAIQIGVSLGPALYVMVRELGHVPHFSGVRRSDFAVLMNISIYMALLQWSVVLADKVDTTVLGFAISDTSFPWITVYQNVSKPFMQIRQTGWTLAYLVMPAVVSLAVGGDKLGLERIKYDGTRFLVALLVPPTLLAGIYAAPFLDLWVGVEFVPFAWMLQLFLVATLPLVLSAIVQMAIGMGYIRLVALVSFAGSLINLPISYVLTRRIGVAGVIWGTVLTTLITNLLIPALVLFPRLEIRWGTFLKRTLTAPILGGLALVVACLVFQLVLSPNPIGDLTRSPEGIGTTTALDRLWLTWCRAWPFLTHLTVGCLAYLAGYSTTATGRGDLVALVRKLLRQPALVPIDLNFEAVHFCPDYSSFRRISSSRVGSSGKIGGSSPLLGRFWLKILSGTQRSWISPSLIEAASRVCFSLAAFRP